MKPALTRILTLVAACGALVCGARAGVNTYSIGFNFATNEPNGASLGGLLPTDVAGVPAVAQPNWNNLSGANGEMTSGIVANQNGTAFPTSVGLTWASEGTWASTGRGEPNGDNYFAPDSPDRILNTGYLDTGNSTTTRITITNLPSDLTTPGYDVYVYALGGVQGRGGSYRILNAADLTELRPYQLGSSANAPTNYVMDTGETHNNETGTYLVFRNLTAPGIVVEATTTVNPTGGTPRAPINAVQLVAAAATGEAEPATGLNITPGDGQIEISWTPGAGSSGSLVVMRAGRRVTAQPVDGVTYTANATFGQGQNLGDDNIGSPNYVVYAGSGNSVTVSNVFGTTNYHVAVYSFTGNNYTLLNPPTGSATPLANLVSLELNVPSSIVRGAAHNVRVLANYSDGGTLDVTASATVTSSVPAVVSILPGPKAAGLSLGSATLTATYETFSTDKDVSVENMSMTHQYSMSGTSGSTDVQDSVGDAHGIVVTPDMFSGQDGGLLLLSGTDSNYVELPANLISDYGALTIETWASDSGNVNWARLFDFGVDANRYLFLSPWAANNGTVRFAITVNGAGSEQQLSSGNAGFGEHHYVLVIEGASRIGRLFVDGMQVALNTNMTLTPEDIGPMPNVWLGRSQYAADGYFNGSINEFRIYNGPLDSLQIALNAATGPNTTVTDPGACTGISLLVVNPNMVAGGDTQQGTVTATFANVGNPVNITTAPQTTYSSSNTNVARVSASGLVTAVGPGDAIITASAFGQNSQVMVTVAEQPIVLSHRYSFTADGTDSIGGFHAALLGNAQIVDGQVFLDGVNANASYVELPGGILADYNSLTFEIWYTDDNAGNWSRVWDFGSSTANYLFFTVRANSQLNARTAITTGSGEQVVNFRRPNMGTEHHIVYTQDAVTGLASIYHNGVLVATNAVTIQPRQLGATTQNWLGRSQFADPYFRGFINEFRIWRGAISPTQVALSYGLGPDNFTTVTNPGAVSSVTVSVPDLAAGQTRQARAIVNFAQVSGVNMAPFASNWISSDISVAKVDQNGVVTGVGPGTATISATYGGVTGNGSVTVSAGTPVLANRYSFDGNANDSVGGAHGTLGAGASISDGAVVLTGANDSFVALPGGLLAGKS
ncbi:MAG TPA: Ig-like domain-containing protein, partial [Verrucomicrobiota bacterium]|nr:Ig-like domain-containing protein [Verrucomicrobiota bacterium]